MKIECLNHVKTLKLKHRLQIPKWQAVGILETLFNFAAVNADDGNIGRYTNDEICLYLEYFDSSDKLIEALIESGFVDVCDENRLSIHDWNEHAPKYIKDRIAKRNKRRAVSQTVGDKTPDVDAGSKMSGKIAINQAQPNQAKPSQKKRVSVSRFDKLLDKWNQTRGVRKIRKLTDKRKRSLQSLDDSWLSDAMTALTKFPLKCWKDGSYVPTFDWFIRSDTVTKILEGAYDWMTNPDAPGASYAPPPEKTLSQQKYSELFQQLKTLQRAGEGRSDEAEVIRNQMGELQCDSSV